jgi:hypothetical protein
LSSPNPAPFPSGPLISNLACRRWGHENAWKQQIVTKSNLCHF